MNKSICVKTMVNKSINIFWTFIINLHLSKSYPSRKKEKERKFNFGLKILVFLLSYQVKGKVRMTSD